MADPVYDEDYIEHLLSHPVSLDNLDAIRMGAAFALCDLYDRKVVRQEFMRGVEDTLRLYSNCSKMWMLKSIYASFDANGLTEDVFQRAFEGVKSEIEQGQQVAVALIKRLKECPTSQDRVH